MPTSYTSILKLSLPATGELSGSWGAEINNSITRLLETAVSGASNIVLADANYTLTTLNGTADDARAMFLYFTGTLTATRTITVPAVSKMYVVVNNTAQSLVITNSGGASVTVTAGGSYLLRCGSAGVFSMGKVSGAELADAVTVATAAASAAVHYPVISDNDTGTSAMQTQSDKLSFVPSTGILTVTGVNVPGSATGAGLDTYVNTRLASPPAIGGTAASTGAFTTLTASTPAVDTNSTNVATTAYVLAQTSATVPIMDGTAAVGAATRFARSDHVHPSDTSRAPTANPTFTGTVTLPATGAGANEAVTKSYADSLAAGIDNHASVKCATPAAITLSGLQAIDGYTTLAADRVLVKNQASSVDNGVYTAAAGTWSRATDWDGAGEVKQGSYVFVENGTVYAKTGWTQQTTGTITVGTTAQVFAQFSAANTYTGSTGITLVGSDFRLVSPVTAAFGGSGFTSYAVGDILYADTTSTLAKRAAVAAGSALISAGVGTAPVWGQVNLTSAVTGTLPVANGGTGVATLTGIAKGNGTGVFTAATGSDITTLIGSSAVPNASNVAVTNDVATATTVYPAWVSTTTGNLPVNVSNSKLSFVPSTGVLTATSFAGALTGSVAATTLSASSTVSGVGFSTYLAAPPAIGGTTPAAIGGTTITAGTQFSGPGTGLTGTATSLTAGAATTANALNTANNYSISKILTFAGAGNSYIIASPDANWGFLYRPGQDGATGAHGFLNAAGTMAVSFSGTGIVSATSFTGAGTGLTGTAASLTAGAVTSLSGHNVSELANNSGYITSSGSCASATNISAYTINQSVGTGNSPSFVDVTITSDESVKTNWRGFGPDMLTKFSKVKRGIYDRLDAPVTQAGVSANSFQEVIAEGVTTDANGKRSISQSATLAILAELTALVLAQGQRIAELEAK